MLVIFIVCLRHSNIFLVVDLHDSPGSLSVPPSTPDPLECDRFSAELRVHVQNKDPKAGYGNWILPGGVGLGWQGNGYANITPE